MKTVFKIFALLTLFAAMVSCSDEDEVAVIPSLEVNYANVAGIWRLSEWNGEKMDGDTRYYYITLNRNEENGQRSFKIHTNLNSFVSQQITGSYELNKDENFGDIISGTYDYTLDTNDGWSHQYVVGELFETSMKWTALDDETEVRIYTRCDEVPADIVAGSRVAKQ